MICSCGEDFPTTTGKSNSFSIRHLHPERLYGSEMNRALIVRNGWIPGHGHEGLLGSNISCRKDKNTVLIYKETYTII